MCMTASLATEAPSGADSLADLLASARPGLVLFAVGLTGTHTAAEDVVHDVFEKVLRNPAAFHAVEAPLAYLRTAVVNRCRSLHRRAFVRRRWEQQQDLRELFASSGADERARSAELMVALGQLRLRQREVILLRYWCDLPYDDIARLLDLPSATVRSIASRAVRALAPILEATDA